MLNVDNLKYFERVQTEVHKNWLRHLLFIEILKISNLQAKHIKLYKVVVS